jgi:hypothetical protein
MKNFKLHLLFVGVLCIIFGLYERIAIADEKVQEVSSVQESEEVQSDFSTGVTFDFLSQYIWRGQHVDKDPVFQPGIDLNYKNLTFNIWGNMDFTNCNNESGEFSEFDYTLTYSDKLPFIDADWLNYSAGFVYYRLPGDEEFSTCEVFLGSSLDVFLNPSITVFRDVDEVKGTYILFGVTHCFDKIFEFSSEVPVGMEISSSIGFANRNYNNFYWACDKEIDKPRFNDFVLSISFPFELFKWTIAPRVSYITLLDEDIRASDSCSSKSDFVLAGISLSREF